MIFPVLNPNRLVISYISFIRIVYCLKIKLHHEDVSRQNVIAIAIVITFNVTAIAFEDVASPHVKSSVPVALRPWQMDWLQIAMQACVDD